MLQLQYLLDLRLAALVLLLPHKMKFFSLFVPAVIATIAAAESDILHYDNIYDMGSESLDVVSCSNGPNGLETLGFTSVFFLRHPLSLSCRSTDHELIQHLRFPAHLPLHWSIWRRLGIRFSWMWNMLEYCIHQSRWRNHNVECPCYRPCWSGIDQPVSGGDGQAHRWQCCVSWVCTSYCGTGRQVGLWIVVEWFCK